MNVSDGNKYTVLVRMQVEKYWGFSVVLVNY